MIVEDMKDIIQNFKNEGHSDEDIISSIYLMFSNGKITFEQFEAIIGFIGYDVSEALKNMDDEEKRTFALSGNKDKTMNNKCVLSNESIIRDIETIPEEDYDYDSIGDTLFDLYEEKSIELKQFIELMSYFSFELDDDFFTEVVEEDQREWAIAYNKEVVDKQIKLEYGIMDKCSRVCKVLKENYKVSDEAIVRPLIFLFLNDKIDKKYVFQMNLCLGEYYDLDEFVDSFNVEMQKRILRNLPGIKETIPNIDENLVWYKNMDEEYRNRCELNEYLIDFYKGYPPYAWNEKKKQWENIALYLKEEDYK